MSVLSSTHHPMTSMDFGRTDWVHIPGDGVQCYSGAQFAIDAVPSVVSSTTQTVWCCLTTK